MRSHNTFVMGKQEKNTCFWLGFLQKRQTINNAELGAYSCEYE